MTILSRADLGLYDEWGSDSGIPEVALLDTARAYHDLRDAVLTLADDLTWKRPERSPCGTAAEIEGCCGSEASCDAMNPSILLCGPGRIREVVARVDGSGNGAGTVADGAV